jgi:hypoxanthine phosphoribosyltransferase
MPHLGIVCICRVGSRPAHLLCDYSNYDIADMVTAYSRINNMDN